MKKKKFSIFIVSLLLMIGLIPSVTVYAWRVDPYNFYISIDKNQMPSQTKYIDILVPLKVSDKEYISLNKENSSTYSISDDSEIVRYCDDEGFRSFLIHYKYSIININKQNNLHKPNINDSLCVKDNITIWEFANKYRKIKVAYLDENGNILSVTNSAKISTFFTRNIQNGELDYRIQVNGTQLNVEIASGPPWYMFVIIIYIFVSLPFIILLFVIIHFIKKRNRKKSIKNM